MSKTKIEWTQYTWNPTVGCSIVSPGCINCYAMSLAYRVECINAEAAAKYKPEPSPQYNGTTKRVNGNAVWTGRVARSEKALNIPLRRKVPTTWFVNSMSDLFHESVPDEWIDQVFAVMALTPQHTYQILTKRSQRMREYLKSDRRDVWADAHAPGKLPITRHEVMARISSTATPEQRWLYHATRVAWPLPNVWLGVSTERQKEADERIPDLLATPAAVRFISAEPLLGPIDLNDIPWPKDHPAFPETDDISDSRAALRLVEGRKLDWVIVGGESGPGARPMALEWAGSIVEQCRAADVACFVKQLSGPKGRAIKDMGLFPPELQTREFPRAA